MSLLRSVFDRGEDAAVQGFEEMGGLQPVDQVVRQSVVDHHRAEHRRFGLDVAGSCCGSAAAVVGVGKASVAIGPP